jgi:riboflavin biosynthesis pyrimidine reductase
MSTLEPFDTLHDAALGEAVPLPPTLERLYGPLRVPSRTGRPTTLANFVTTLDGVVSLGIPGHAGGGPISGNDPHDRMLMGLLRAVADAVVVGAGTLRADDDHLWTADHVFPDLAPAYRELRAALGKSGPPLNVIVSASGELDFGLRVFASGEVPVLVVTTGRGAERLRREEVPPSVRIAAVPCAEAIGAGAILGAVSEARPAEVVLVEGGPHLLGGFLAAGILDQLFLTLAPQIAGREAGDARPGLVAGQRFAPEHPLWSGLVVVKRAGSHLFLRYAVGTGGAPARPR